MANLIFEISQGNQKNVKKHMDTVRIYYGRRTGRKMPMTAILRLLLSNEYDKIMSEYSKTQN